MVLETRDGSARNVSKGKIITSRNHWLQTKLNFSTLEWNRKWNSLSEYHEWLLSASYPTAVQKVQQKFNNDFCDNAFASDKDQWNTTPMPHFYIQHSRVVNEGWMLWIQIKVLQHDIHFFSSPVNLELRTCQLNYKFTVNKTKRFQWDRWTKCCH